VSPLIQCLRARGSILTATRRYAAVSLSRLAADEAGRQDLLADEGVLDALVTWLLPDEERPEGSAALDASLRPVAALALADVVRGNRGLKARAAAANAIAPLVRMLDSSNYRHADNQEAACAALATLAVDDHPNQLAVASASAVPLLISLLQHSKLRIREHASRAVAMLLDAAENTAPVANAGGMRPLVSLLTTGSPLAQQYAARAVRSLADGSADNQLALVREQAVPPLTSLLGSDALETQGWAQMGLFHLAAHVENRPVVVKWLVSVLGGRQPSAQLRAADALARLLEIFPSASLRKTVAQADAVAPLVALLGNGQRADLNTPPERSAAVLANLAPLMEVKMSTVREGGLQPICTMLSSACAEAQAHAVCSVWHLSMVAESTRR
jgi:hypothetical protein